jgi:hypothetical protein
VRKLAQIIGDENHFEGKRVRGDPEIIAANDFALARMLT